MARSASSTPDASSDGRRDGGRERRPGRWRWALPALLVVVWLLVGGPLGSFAGRLAEVQQNDNADFLPSSAESTKALEASQAFSDLQALPAIVLWVRDGGLTQADLANAAGVRERLAEVEGVAGEQISPPIPSQDGKAVQVIVPVTAGFEELAPTVDELDAIAQAGRGDATVYVTGPAGILGDFSEAFGSIDTTLLLVAASAVLLILLVVYRSPVLPPLVLLSAMLALGAASAAVYALAKADVIDVNGQSQGILFILVVGAATDYALLLVSRFREELRDHASRFTAMRVALRGAVEPIVASGLTVGLGVLCLLLSDLSSTRGLGPVAAVGIAFAMVSVLTFLPALLVLLGRAAFWPFMPRLGSEHPEVRGMWGRVARFVGRHARPVWMVTAAALLAASFFVTRLDAQGVPQSELFLNEVASVTGQEVLARHFPAGSGSPANLVGPAGAVDRIVAVAEGTEGVASAAPVPATPQGPPGAEPAAAAAPKVVGGRVLVEATLTDQPDSLAAEETVKRLRERLDEVGTDVLVGGETAIQLDVRDSSIDERWSVIPAILAVIFVVLALLLRSLVAPLVLLVANVLSFGATLGISALVFEYVFDFPGADAGVVTIAFVFLVALGVDYSIFLMTRVREESIKRGTREGVDKGLALTGGVITSAGIVLAATFSALGVLPILFLAQIAFIVAFGVLLDTFVVRSLLVPAISHDLGRLVWWPSRLSRRPDEPAGSGPAPAPEPEPQATR